jgi:hypothetical protein
VSQINPVYALPPFYLKIHYNIILPSSLRLPGGLFPSGFTTKTLYVFLLSSTCHILLDLTTRLIFVKQYGPWRSPLCSVLHSPLTPPLLDPNIFLSTLLSNTLSLTVHIQHYSSRTMVAGIPSIQSAFNFFTSVNLTCYCRAQIFEHWHAFILLMPTLMLWYRLSFCSWHINLSHALN